ALVLQARSDGLLRQHPVDREVLAHIAEEVDRRELRGPVEVVDDLRGMGPEKSRNFSTWVRILFTHSSTTSRGLSVRSPDIRGSPMRPVAPPTRASGLCPAC